MICDPARAKRITKMNKMSPIMDAYTRCLPACPRCGALSGDPCRTPAWKTTKAHQAREESYKKVLASKVDKEAR